MDKEVIKALSKPAEKLIEEVSKWIWGLYKPRAIRKKADAEAYKIEMEANAKAKSMMIQWEAQIQIIERAKARLGNQEIIRQENIEEIAEKSLLYLPESVSEEPVDTDWRTRFFTKAQDISSNEMQEIWAKILAEEISTPWKTSLRTLDVLANISKNEAELFSKACKIASQDRRILKLDASNLEKYWLWYWDIMVLRDAWLIHDSDNLIVKNQKIDLLGWAVITLWEQAYIVKWSFWQELKLKQLPFTQAWIELCRWIEIKIDEKYVEEYIKFLTDKWYSVEELVPWKKY